MEKSRMWKRRRRIGKGRIIGKKGVWKGILIERKENGKE